MIRGNQYKAVIEAQAEALRKDLTTLNSAVEQLIILQKAWIYQENIFSSPEIKKILPTATAQFEGVDKFFKNLMGKIEKNSSASKLLKSTSNLVS